MIGRVECVDISANSLRFEKTSLVLQATKKTHRRAAETSAMVGKKSKAALDEVSNPELQAPRGLTDFDQSETYNHTKKRTGTRET